MPQSARDSHDSRRVSGKKRQTAWLSIMLFVTFSGCQASVPCSHRHLVSDELEARMGVSLTDSSAQPLIPHEVQLSDGIAEDEAVTIALWNNAAFQELLAQLGISSAQLLEAGLISDPQFTVFFPLGPKQLEFAGFQAIDALWLRPIRIRAANLDLFRVADQMVQGGLNVIRDVRLAHAELVKAQDQASLAHEAHTLRQGIADLTEKRLHAGDISQLEAATAKIDAQQAFADVLSSNRDVEIARERLLFLMGLSLMEQEEVVSSGESVEQSLPPQELSLQSAQPVAAAALQAVAADVSDLDDQDIEQLVSAAFALRPDLRAAEIEIEAANQRARLAGNQYFNIEAILDANERGRDGFEAGPGLRFTLPLLNGNRGGMAIADANLRQAARRYMTIRDQVILEVRTASIQYTQAVENLELMQQQILPRLDEAVKLAHRSFENGAADYVLVLQTMQQFLNARQRVLELEAAKRRALAELERSVGQRLVARTPTSLANEPADGTTADWSHNESTGQRR